ncbi:hypothetical protein Tco_0890451 [Tanacetum coccineum]|uniref:Uncharacterized protein n=1 Tax=Tanacetum coccineum TaxID=301880 RepID=A0ABQ5C617_9ASTR
MMTSRPRTRVSVQAPFWGCDRPQLDMTPILRADAVPVSGFLLLYLSLGAALCCSQTYLALCSSVGLSLYVQGTLELGLHLYAFATTSLVGYTDAD